MDPPFRGESRDTPNAGPYFTLDRSSVLDVPAPFHVAFRTNQSNHRYVAIDEAWIEQCCSKNPRTTNPYFTLDRSSVKQKVAHDFACDPSTAQNSRVFVFFICVRQKFKPSTLNIEAGKSRRPHVESLRSK